MKIAVLGANGKTGRLAVEEALRRGHQVVAAVRNPARVAAEDERLTVARADAFDESSLEKAFAGVDAVISTLGRSTQKGPNKPVFAAAMRNTLSAMKSNDVHRLSVISAQGVSEESDAGLAPMLRVLRFMLGSAIDDMREMEHLVKASETVWTIVRPGGLNNQPKGQYVVSPGNALKGHGRTRRADLAEVLVLAVTEEPWPGQAVVVAS